MKRVSTSLIGLGLLGLLAFAGCQDAKAPKIAVGKVDTAKLLEGDPDYQSMSVSYLREATDIRQEFVEKLKATDNERAKVEKLQSEFQVRQIKFDEAWRLKTEDFLSKRHDSIRGTAEAIAKRKNIDLVLIDSEMYPTVEWGGVDMTKDMSLAMSDGSQTENPAATATPNGEAE